MEAGHKMGGIIVTIWKLLIGQSLYLYRIMIVVIFARPDGRISTFPPSLVLGVKNVAIAIDDDTAIGCNVLSAQMTSTSLHFDVHSAPVGPTRRCVFLDIATPNVKLAAFRTSFSCTCHMNGFMVAVCDVHNVGRHRFGYFTG